MSIVDVLCPKVQKHVPVVYLMDLHDFACLIGMNPLSQYYSTQEVLHVLHVNLYKPGIFFMEYR